MPLLKKAHFIRFTIGVVMILFIVKLCIPSLTLQREEQDQEGSETTAESELQDDLAQAEQPKVSSNGTKTSNPYISIAPPAAIDFSYRHPVRGVHSYNDGFHDVQDVQYPTARQHGVQPLQSRNDVSRSQHKLVYIGASPYYIIGHQMQQSIPYLVPRAAHLLQHIGRSFIDSLAAKQLPLHTIVVTSALRTEQDAARLRRTNTNASEQSCHRFGTTIDISYRSFYDVAADTQEPTSGALELKLKQVLSEVLRDCRKAGLCWVMYERKQSCFHITVR
ncbi:MAG: hypothetical protein J5486_07110 [Bacteroidaceae bacterium]|nr:hypothetical protein [Bacteroidaceae bacterium]